MDTTCFKTSEPKFPSLVALVTIIPAVVEIISAGIALINPSQPQIK